MVRWKKPLNFGCFQVGWFACALGAAHSWPLMGPLVVGVLLILQLPLVPAPGKQARFVSVAMLAGWLIDSGLARAGVSSFPAGRMLFGLCPLWMAALWANFAGSFTCAWTGCAGATGWRRSSAPAAGRWPTTAASASAQCSLAVMPR